MSSLTLYQKKQTNSFGGWNSGWETFSDYQNVYDITNTQNAWLAAGAYSAQMSISSGQKLTGCTVKVNLKNVGSASGSATVHCYLYTSDPTTNQNAQPYETWTPPSGSIGHVTAAVSLNADAGKYQTFSFTGLNVSSGTMLYFLFYTFRSSGTWLISMFNWNNGTSGFGAPTVGGTFTTPPTITSHPSSVTAESGNTATFQVTASGTGLSYQWQYRTSSSGTWASATATGNKTATLSVPATTDRNGYQYRCTVTNAAGTVYSNAATLTVIAKPVITAHPQNVTTTAGTTVTYRVTATGATSYQWQYYTGSAWANVTNSDYTGLQSATMTVPATTSRNGLRFRCAVTNSAGTVYSNGATLTVLSLSVSPAAVTTGSAVTITVNNGSSIAFSATVKYGSTTLATQSLSNGTAQITCPRGWFDTAGVTTGKSLSLSVTVTGGGHSLSGSFTLNAGDDMKPTVGTPTASVVDLTGNFPSTYIAGYSQVKVAAAITLPTNATVSSVKLSYPGGTTVTMSYNSSTGKYEGTTAGPITGNTTFTVTVTDARGMSGSNTVSVSGVVAYTRPSITIDTGYTYRCNASGTKTDGGAYYRVKATRTMTSFSGNAITKFTVKIKGTSSETNLSNGTQTGAISGMNNENSRYTIVVTVQDKVSSAVSVEYTLESAARNIVVRRSGDGTYVGVGTAPSRSSGPSSIELPTNGAILVGGQDILGGVRFLTFYIASGASATVTFPNSPSTSQAGMIFSSGSYANGRGMTAYSNYNGNTYVTVLAGSTGLTFSASGNTISITNGTQGIVRFAIMMMNGGMPTVA